LTIEFDFEIQGRKGECGKNIEKVIHEKKVFEFNKEYNFTLP